MRFGIFVKFLSDGICSDPDSLGEEIQAKLGGFFALGSKKIDYERRGMTPKGSQLWLDQGRCCFSVFQSQLAAQRREDGRRRTAAMASAVGG